MGAALCVIIPEGVNEVYESTMRREILEAIQHRNSTSTSHTKHGLSAHVIVGLTLLLGFVMMLVIDQISSNFSTPHGYNSLPTHHNHSTSPPPPPSSQSNDSNHNRNSKQKSDSTSFVASIGLIIHSAGL